MQSTKMSSWGFMSTKGQGNSLTLVQFKSDSIFLNFFFSITADFNISSALRWVIQDQWSSGCGNYTMLNSLFFWYTSFLTAVNREREWESKMKSVWEASHSHWDRICSHVNHAVVFIDNLTAEALHWHGGLSRLISAGATDVKEFSSFEVSSVESVEQIMWVFDNNSRIIFVSSP